jgi:prophage regulatory protein
MVDTFLRDAVVTHRTGVPRSTRYEMIERGAFPRPIKLSPRLVVWSEAEIAEWQAARIAERGAALAAERPNSKGSEG